MSVWKFWTNQSQKSKVKVDSDKDSDGNQDQVVDDIDDSSEFSPENSPTFERHKNRHHMSVSRSGRYKQKIRKRSGILDHPDFLDSGLLSNRHTATNGLDRQKSIESQSFCEEDELYDLHVSCDHFKEGGRKENFKQGSPRICDLQKHTDIQVVAI